MSIRVVALVGILLSTGCARHFAEVADASIGGASRDAGFAVTARASAAASVPTDRYVQMAGRKTTPGTAFVQTTPDLWAPYDVQIRTGFFDLEQTASPQGLRVCLEVDDVGFDVFYLVCGQYQTGLGAWQTFAGTNLGNLPGSVNIASDEIELRVEQVGDDINFHARAAGAMSWTLVSSTDFPAQTAAHKASFGASSLTKGNAAGFDDLIATSSPEPVAPTGALAVAFDVNLALRDAWDAFRELDAGAEDFDGAEGELAGAGDALDGAQLGLAGLPASKDNQTAGKLISKAQKGIAKALAQVQDEDAAKALKTLEKMAPNLIEASLLLSPQPFPNP